MVDLAQLSIQAPPSRQSKPNRPDGGYQAAGEVRRRAQVSADGESPANSAALKRLERLLGREKPLDADVPRGFYLNLVL